MTRKRLHVCLNVRSFLTSAKFPRDYKRMLKHADGCSMTPEEARDALFDEIAKGHEVIPMNNRCGNPCRNSPTCPGFKFKEDGEQLGCPGYEVDESGNPIAVAATEASGDTHE